MYLVYKNVIFSIDSESSKAKKSILRYRQLNKVVYFYFQVFYYRPVGKNSSFENFPNSEFGLSLAYFVYQNDVFNMDLESSKAKKSILTYWLLNKVVSFFF